MAGGQNEAVPVDPGGIRRIVPQKAVPQYIRHRRRPQRQARMAGLRLFDGVDRQKPQCIDTKLIRLIHE